MLYGNNISMNRGGGYFCAFAHWIKDPGFVPQNRGILRTISYTVFKIKTKEALIQNSWYVYLWLWLWKQTNSPALPNYHIQHKFFNFVCSRSYWLLTDVQKWSHSWMELKVFLVWPCLPALLTNPDNMAQVKVTVSLNCDLSTFIQRFINLIFKQILGA